MNLPETTTQQSNVSDFNELSLLCEQDKTIPYLQYRIENGLIYITKICCDGKHKSTKEYSKFLSNASRANTSQSESNLFSPCDFGKHLGDTDHHEKEWFIDCLTTDVLNDIINTIEEGYFVVKYHCDEHMGKELRYYCKNCKHNICLQCSELTHKGHLMIFVSDLINDPKISEWINNISMYKEQYFSFMKKWYIMYLNSLNTEYKSKWDKIKLRCGEVDEECNSNPVKYNDNNNNNNDNDNVKTLKQSHDIAVEQCKTNYDWNVKTNTALFNIIDTNIKLYRKHKKSFNYNWYLNMVNIWNLFNKTLFTGVNNTNHIVEIREINNYFINTLILTIDNVSSCLPLSITKTPDKPNTLNMISEPNHFTVTNTKNYPGTILSLVKLNSSHFAIGCGYPDNIYIVEYPRLEIIHTLSLHSAVICRLHLHKTTNYLLSLSSDRTICVWNHSTGALIVQLKGHINAVVGVVEWENGDIVTIGDDKAIKFWCMKRFCCYNTIESPNYLHDILLLDNQWITGGKQMIIWWNEDAIKKEDWVTKIRCTDRWVYSLLLKGDMLLAGTFEGGILIYTLHYFEFKCEVKEHSSFVNSLILLSGGLVASGSYDTTIKIWNIDEKRCLKTLPHEGGIYTGWIEWDDKTIICGSSMKQIKVWMRK